MYGGAEKKKLIYLFVSHFLLFAIHGYEIVYIVMVLN